MWFAGSVKEAIAKTRSESKLLLVFIEGSDPQSAQSLQSLESIQDQVLNRTVPIKLTAGSQNAIDFGQFYPILVVPAAYIITPAGVAVEVVAGAIKSHEFVTKLELAGVQMQQLKVPTTGIRSPVAGPSGSTTPVPSPVLTNPPPPSPVSPAQPVLEDKLALAQRKLEELKAKKEKEEEEKERQREQERRETGKAVLTAKRRREEQEMLEAANERKRDAQLEKEHRAKVLAQIQQDKEERRKRFAKQQDQAAPTEPEVKSPPPVSQPTVTSDQTKIQFRFPDGHTLTSIFQSQDKLQSARDFVAASEPSLASGFSMSQMYPRKTFADTDLVQSFDQLQLVPTSVLLIIPKSGSSSFRSQSTTQSASSSSSVAQSSLIASYIPWFLLLPFITFWNFISSFMPTSVPRDLDSGSGPSATGQQSGIRQSSPYTDPQPSTSGLRRRDLPASSGNIHRLREDDDSEDDEHKKKKTWNGNSTQQM